MSGVNHTYFSIEGGCWQEYFGGPLIFVDEDGKYTIQYFSIDKAGNYEEVKSTTFKFDTNPPYLDLNIKRLFSYFFIITTTCYDCGSGISHVEFYLDDMLKKVIEGSGPKYKWFLCWPIFKKLIIKVIAYDKAGYSSTNVTNVVAVQSGVATVQPKEIDVEPKDYLFQTIVDITNNPDVNDIHSLLERYQVIQKKLTTIIKDKDELNRLKVQLSDLPCDCENDDTTQMSFPVLCYLLLPLYIFSVMAWAFAGIYQFYNVMMYIGYILNCPWF